MSEIQFCPRGEQDGIVPAYSEQHALAVAMDSKYTDAYILIPDCSIEDQVKRIAECLDHAEPIYWETDIGSHGWCCSHCGTVVQWG